MAASGEDLLKANAADEATQQARLKALQGKSCLWITAPVIPMMSATLQSRCTWANKQGVEVVAVFHSKEDKLYAVMEENKLFSKAIFADLHADDVGDQVVAAIEAAGVTVHSVFSPYEQCQTIVGEVATKLGLQANPRRAYEVARSKNLTRDVCREAGLPTPRAGTCGTLEELRAVLDHVQFPAILKPSSGAGSAGVFRVDDMEAAEKAFAVIQADVVSNDGLSWNPGLAPNTCLVEELLVGSEFDVDILMWDSKAVYMRSVDNWDCIPPYFLETGSNMPSTFPREKLDVLEKYSVDCVLACGFTFGCFHVESMYTAEGPRLIEVNARQGGGCMQEFNEEMHGVDMFANFFISTFGVPINPPAKEADFAMADYSITCPTTGVVRDIGFVDEIRADPHVVRCTSFVKPGDKVKGYDTGFPVWLGELVVKAPTPAECAAVINSIVERVAINIDADTAAAAAATAAATEDGAGAADASVASAQAPAPPSKQAAARADATPEVSAE